MGKASLVEKRRDWKNTFAKKKEYKGKEGKVERRSGVLQRRLRNARNGIPRSQLRSHPDLTRPYSGLIVIAFCLFARRSFLRLRGRACSRTRVALFTGALITFLFLSAKNRTLISNYPTLSLSFAFRTFSMHFTIHVGGWLRYRKICNYYRNSTRIVDRTVFTRKNDLESSILNLNKNMFLPKYFILYILCILHIIRYARSIFFHFECYPISS